MKNTTLTLMLGAMLCVLAGSVRAQVPQYGSERDPRAGTQGGGRRHR